MLVTALKGLKVVDVACGSGDAQTLAVTENGKKIPEKIQPLHLKTKMFLFQPSVSLLLSAQVRFGPGETETTASWAEEAATAARHRNSWRNCRTWTL